MNSWQRNHVNSVLGTVLVGISMRIQSSQTRNMRDISDRRYFSEITDLIFLRSTDQHWYQNQRLVNARGEISLSLVDLSLLTTVHDLS